jgi:hypothetical protein
MRFSVFKQADFRWILEASDPLELAFPDSSPFAGWSLISPLAPPPEGSTSQSFGEPPACAPLGGGRCLVSHRRMDFVAPKAEGAAAMNLATKLLRWLRFTCGQVALATDIAGYQVYPDTSRKTSIAAPFTEPAAFLLVRRIDKTALTFARIRSSLDGDPSMTVPLYADLFLDAIEADGDDRRVILYAAIAVEAMLGTRLDEAFKDAVFQRPADFRMVPDPEGKEPRDPIREQLRRDARRNFSVFLHELPLYILGRSLRADQPALFSEVMLLRETRNMLAHTGDPGGRAVLPIDADGAKRALSAAIGAYRWFDARGRYVTLYGHEWLGR